MAKICKDGRILGQNNRTHNLGIFKGKYIKSGFNLNSKGRRFEIGSIPWNKGKPGLQIPWNKGVGQSGPYSSEFLFRLRDLIRERDGYKCQECGCPQVECMQKLCVHHIDYNKNNNDPKNLISLCRSCHAKTQTRRSYWEENFHVRANNNK